MNPPIKHVITPDQRFGRLMVVRETRIQVGGRKPRTLRGAVCVCDCGKEVTVYVGALARGIQVSCGCFHREDVQRQGYRNRTHGLSRTPLYDIWCSMLARCSDPEHCSYSNYGARGISVYGPWRSDPAAFINWIHANLGPRPEGKHPSGYAIYTIDRINNDGNYEPGNLRWATASEQLLNQRRSAPEPIGRRGRLRRHKPALASMFSERLAG